MSENKATKSIWTGEKFCGKYHRDNQISTDDVHYGYLAPGDNKLNLLGGDFRKKNILEICCGRAQNSIALAKRGANCVGVDISPVMIAGAKELARKNGVKITLQKMDCSGLQNKLPYSANFFDIVISSYGVCFVGGIDKLFKQINFFLKLNGNFTFCVTHPCQIPFEINDIFISETDNEKWDESYLTINQAISYLNTAGFLVVSIVEQKTINPSRMTEEEKSKFPYIPLKLDPQFDSGSEKPHTIIYSCRKIKTVSL